MAKNLRIERCGVIMMDILTQDLTFVGDCPDLSGIYDDDPSGDRCVRCTSNLRVSDESDPLVTVRPSEFEKADMNTRWDVPIPDDCPLDAASTPHDAKWAEGVLPSGEWEFRSRYPQIFAHRSGMGYIGISHCGNGLVLDWGRPDWDSNMTRDQRDAAEILFAAMQGDSPEVVALRAEYTR